MAIQSTPPVQLDPSQDNGHQLAFINQNFQSIANVLQQNSFVIVKQGFADQAAFSAPLVANQYTGAVSTTTIAHGLSYTPLILTYYFDGSFYVQLPYFNTVPAATNATWFSYSSKTDNTNMYFTAQIMCYNQASSSATIPGIFKYYLLQQTAN